MLLSHPLVALAIFTPIAPVARAQTPLAEFSSNYVERVGWILHNVGDLNGDGLDDLAAAYAGGPETGAQASDVRIYALTPARTVELTRWQVTVPLPKDNVRFAGRGGEALAVLRRDGAEFEIALGAPGVGEDGKRPGVVIVYPARTNAGSIAREGVAPAGEYGAALALLPELDEDRRGELAVGAPGADRVELLSGSLSTRLGEIRSTAAGARFGAALARLPGAESSWETDELVVGAPDDSTHGFRRGALHVHQIADGARCRSFFGTLDGQRFGARVLVDDLDEDGVSELVVASLGSESACARIEVIDSRTGSLRWEHTLSSFVRHEVDLRIAISGDLNRDGCRDVLITWLPLASRETPEALVLSGATGDVVHAIRGYGAERSPKGRAFLSQPVERRLASLIGLVGAGDQDGDGIEDLWFAMRSGANEPYLRGSISLLSGAQLGTRADATGSLSRSAPIGARVRAPAGASAEKPGAQLAIAELPKIFVSEAGDGLDDEARGFVCVDSGYGRVVRTLGDLDGNGRDDLWVTGFGSVWDDYYSFLLDPTTGQRRVTFKNGDFSGAVRVHDVDGDGADDFVLGASERTFRFCEMVGEALVVSSKTNNVLREIKHPGGAYAFANSLVLAGDVDGDGVRDLAVGVPATAGWGCPDARQEARTCQVSFIALGSDKLGTTIATVAGDATTTDRFGEALAFGGDWDGDGVGDLAVGAPRDGSRAERAGAVHIYSGTSLERVACFASSVPGEGLGRELAWGGDIDGDGRAELIVAAPWSGEDQRGRVVVLSSKSRAPLWQLRGREPWDAFGASLALGDLDGDGALELVVGAPGAWRESEPHPASVSIFDFATGRELARIQGEPCPPAHFMEGVQWTSRLSPYSYGEVTLPRFGRSLAIAGDLDGDGVPDLVIGSPTYLGPQHAGAVYALSGHALREQMK